jgi:hypothetical protein
MRHLLSGLAVSALLLTCATPASAQVSFGVTIGRPPAPRAYHVPARPGPDYEWIEGYWYPQSGHYKWHDGYWTRVPYAGAYWVQPYYAGGKYYQGYWDGAHGHYDHDHRWDKDHDRRDDHRYDEHHDDHHR